MDIKLIIKATAADSKELFIVLDEPASVEVKEQLKQPITFAITFAVDICDGQLKTLPLQSIGPFSDVEIHLEIDGEVYCLIKGVVQSQDIKLVHGGQGSQIVVSGADNSVRLGWVTETRNWNKKMMKEHVFQMLSKVQKSKKDTGVKNYTFDEYRIMGETFSKDGVLIESDEKSVETGIQNEEQKMPSIVYKNYMEFEHAQLQSQDDLSFIKRLADQQGMYFWVSYGQDARQIVHLEKLPIRDLSKKVIQMDPDALTLAINFGDNDLDEFSISWDVDRPTSVVSELTTIRERKDHTNKLANAPQPKLGNMTLDSMTGYLLESFQSIIVSNEGEMKERNDAALNEAEWFIKANCSTSYDRLCKNKDIVSKKFGPIIHAHTVINIEGAGSRHSGAYLVSGVTHSITPGSYKVQLNLMRNAWSEPDKVPEENQFRSAESKVLE